MGRFNPIEIESFERITEMRGPFQGEPRWAPAFVENWLALTGAKSLPYDKAVRYLVTHEDSDDFPEVAGIREVLLLRTETGDVWTSVVEPRFPRPEPKLMP